jgi:hypothetical protein
MWSSSTARHLKYLEFKFGFEVGMSNSSNCWGGLLWEMGNIGIASTKGSLLSKKKWLIWHNFSEIGR